MLAMASSCRYSVGSLQWIGLATLALLSARQLAHAADADGVFDPTMASPGGASYSGGVATEDASAAHKAVPADSSAHVPDNYYHLISDWFTSWLAENGVDTNSWRIDIQNITNPEPWQRPNMKLVATRHLSPGEIVFKIPQQLQVSSSAVMRSSPFYADPNHPAESWTAYTALASWLLKERSVDTASPWVAYVRLLPPHVTSPIFFPLELVQELQFQNVIDTVEAYNEAISAEYAACSAQALASATREEFAWAVSMALSRSFRGSDPSANEGDAADTTLFLPLADLMDHSNQYNIHYSLDSEGAFVFSALSHIAEGEELLNQYGLKNTDQLLLSYGFVLNPNEHDSVSLIMRKNSSTSIYNAFFTGSTGLLDDDEADWAEELAAKAELETAQVALEEKENFEGLTGPRYELGSFYDWQAWAGGLVDPPLLASVAATIHYFFYGTEPQYPALARLSIWWGWNLYAARCQDLGLHAEATPEETQALVSAVAGVKAMVQAILKQLPTTLEDDLYILSALKACQAGGETLGASHVSEEYCAKLRESTVPWADRELVVTARMLKKRVLKDLIERIDSSCALSTEFADPEETTATDGVKAPPLPQGHTGEAQMSSEEKAEEAESLRQSADNAKEGQGKREKSSRTWWT